MTFRKSSEMDVCWFPVMNSPNRPAKHPATEYSNEEKNLNVYKKYTSKTFIPSLLPGLYFSSASQTESQQWDFEELLGSISVQFDGFFVF